MTEEKKKGLFGMCCENCPFFAHTDVKQGECHLKPPSVITTPATNKSGIVTAMQVRSVFPPVSTENFCGCHPEIERVTRSLLSQKRGEV